MPTAGAAAALAVGNSVTASLIAGVAVPQLGGTDNCPTLHVLPASALSIERNTIANETKKHAPKAIGAVWKFTE